MKKIFIFSAVLALLTLSLNAQDVESKAFNKSGVHPTQTTTVAKAKAQIPTMNELLSGINGMSSILQAASNTDAASSAAGAWRAPLKINADEYTVGPFEGDNVGSTAMGYHSAYPDPQWITVTTELTRDEFINYVGDEIVGFRFALGGNTSRIHKVSDFIAYPRTASGFDTDNIHTWNLPNIAGAASVDSYGDIVIETDNGYVGFKSIIVYSGSTVVTQWVGATDETTTPSSWVWTSASHFASNNDGSYYMTYGSTSGGGIITIPSSLFNDKGYSGDLTVVINAGVDAGQGTENLGITVNGTEKTVTNENPSFQDFTWAIPPTGSTTPNYVELNGGYTGDGGNWHEFYLPEPVVFNVASDVEALRMGYTVLQYPTSEETFYRFPIGLNDQSTGHNHYVYRYGPETTTGPISKTVADGTTTNAYLPVYGNYHDYGYKNQMIYSADLLGLEAGTEITSLTFYPGSYGIAFYGSTINLSLANTTTSNFASSTSYLTGLTQVASVSVTAANTSATELTFTFDQPFTYTGDNIVVQIQCAGYRNDGTSGYYSNSNFLGQNQSSSVSLRSYGSSAASATTGTALTFLPKATFNGTGNTTTYSQKWYTADFSERGDLTVQLIFKSNLPKTDAPTLLDMVDNGDGTYTITATATNPTATVTLTIGDQTVTGTGSASITLTQGENAQNVTATATAKEDGKRDSDPATRDYTIPAMGKTATPTITYEETPAAVIVTATGEGTVTLVVNGVTYTGEGTVSATIVRSPEERTVTATATAKDGDLLVSDPDTKDITVHALAGPDSDVEGLLRLHLLLIDQMLEEIPDDNSHPDRYGYVLRYEPNGPQGEGIKESSTVYVDIQKADCDVTGYYSLKEIDNDVNIGINHDQGITMDVVTADVAYNLSSNNDLLWEYLLQGAKDRYPEYQQDYLTKLRKTQNFTYVEMLEGPNKGDEYPNGEHHFLGEEQTGTYGSTFMSYAPSVSTWGIQRRYFEEDGYDNTYGAPIWKSAVGKVVMDQATKPIAERQKNSVNSVNWTDEGGAASLYILDNVKATGYLPHTDIATVKYEPYMFRIFVESENGLLRPYKVVPQGEGDYDGEHLEAVDRELTEADKKGPLCVWSGYIDRNDDDEIVGDPANGVEITLGSDGNQTTYTYLKKKVDRENQSIAWIEYDTIKDPETGEVIDIVLVNDRNAANAMFGALDQLALGSTISESDLNIFVRFYYVVKGMADGWVPGSRGLGDDPAGYGAESPGMSPDPATGVSEIQYLGEVVETIYYNIQGMKSDKPFDGVNIVVTRFGNGTTSVSKIVR